MDKECDLFLNRDGQLQGVGTCTFTDFEPQCGDLILDNFTGMIDKPLNVLVYRRQWRDGKLELLVREDYRIVVYP